MHPTRSHLFSFLQPINSNILKLLFPVALCHALGHVTSNVSFAAVAVSFTHTIKGSSFFCYISLWILLHPFHVRSCFIIAIQLWSPSSTRPLLSLSLDSRFPWLCGCPLPLLSSVIFNSILWYDVLLKLPITVPIASVNATSLGWRTLLHIPTFTSLCVLTFDTIGIFLV